MSVRQVLRMKNIISLRGVILLYHQRLITTNKELSGTIVGRMNVWMLGVKGLNLSNKGSGKKKKQPQQQQQLIKLKMTAP